MNKKTKPPKKEKKPRVKRERRKITREMVKQATIDGICYVAGCVCYALSVIIFTAPNHIAPGGVTGVATVLNYLWNVIPIGTAIFVMNIPLLIASWLKAGRSFTVRTLIGTFLSSACIDLLEPFVPPFADNTLLVPIFGGVLMGLGVGLLIMRGASTGGSEIVARLLERKMPHIPIGRFILLVDAVIVVISAFVFHDVYAAMYAIILIFVSSIVTDALVYGGDKGKMALIISNKEEEIAQEILVKMDRGVTKLCSKGGYSGEERHMLMCAVRPSQMYALRRLVVGIDPGAFIIVTTTDDVFGEGFKSAEKD